MKSIFLLNLPLILCIPPGKHSEERLLQDADILYHIQPHLTNPDVRLINRKVKENYDKNIPGTRVNGMKAMRIIEIECGFQAAEKLFGDLKEQGRVRPSRALNPDKKRINTYSFFPFGTEIQTKQSKTCFHALQNLCEHVPYTLRIPLYSERDLNVFRAISTWEWRCNVALIGSNELLSISLQNKPKIIGQITELKMALEGNFHEIPRLSGLKSFETLDFCSSIRKMPGPRLTAKLEKLIDLIIPDTIEQITLKGYQETIFLQDLYKRAKQLSKVELSTLSVDTVPNVAAIKLRNFVVPRNTDAFINSFPRFMKYLNIHISSIEPYPSGFFQELINRVNVDVLYLSKVHELLSFPHKMDILHIGAIPRMFPNGLRELHLHLNSEQVWLQYEISPIFSNSALQYLSIDAGSDEWAFVPGWFLASIPPTLKSLTIRNTIITATEGQLSSLQECHIEHLSIDNVELNNCGALLQLLDKCPLKTLKTAQISAENDCFDTIIDSIPQLNTWIPPTDELMTLRRETKIIKKLNELNLDASKHLEKLWRNIPHEIPRDVLHNIETAASKLSNLDIAFLISSNSWLFQFPTTLRLGRITNSVKPHLPEIFSTAMNLISLHIDSKDVELSVLPPYLKKLFVNVPVREELLVHGMDELFSSRLIMSSDPVRSLKRLVLTNNIMEDNYLLSLIERLPSVEFGLIDCTIRISSAQTLEIFLKAIAIRDIKKLHFEKLTVELTKEEGDQEEAQLLTIPSLLHLHCTSIRFNSNTAFKLVSNFIKLQNPRILHISALSSSNDGIPLSTLYGYISALESTVDIINTRNLNELYWERGVNEKYSISHAMSALRQFSEHVKLVLAV